MQVKRTETGFEVAAASYRLVFDGRSASAALTKPGEDSPAATILFAPQVNGVPLPGFGVAQAPRLCESQPGAAAPQQTVEVACASGDRRVALKFFLNEAGISFTYTLDAAEELTAFAAGAIRGDFAQVRNFGPDLPLFDIPVKVGARVEISSRRPNSTSFFQLDQGNYMIPPYLFALRNRRQFVGIGLLDVPESALPMDAQVNVDRALLSFDYRHAPVRGEYTSPRIGVYLAETDEGILDAYRRLLETEVVPSADPPEWWRDPIYTTWGDQVYRKHIEEGHFTDEANSEAYLSAGLVTEALAHLRSKGLEPKTVVLDEGWSRRLGDWTADDAKFNGSLAGFIRQMQGEGRRVVLCFKPFIADARSAVAAEHPEYLIHAADGKPKTLTCGGRSCHLFDWSHSGFREHIRGRLAHMLSASGLNADGLKVAGTKFLPEPSDALSNPGFGRSDRFILAALRALHGFAREAKAQAPISLPCLNPLFAPYFDIVRLGNTSEVNHDVYPQRAFTASWLMPDKVIDTDDWASYMKVVGPATAIKAVTGVPNLFSAFYRGDGRARVNGAMGGAPMAIPEEMYRLLAGLWRVYERSKGVRRDRLRVDYDRMEFSTRPGADGSLVRTFQGGNILAVYAPDGITLTSLLDTRAILDLPAGCDAEAVTRFDRSGRRESVPFQRCLGNKILFRALSCRDETLCYHIQGTRPWPLR